ncbi:MAG: hypothetical protein ACI3YG_08450 [Prevotella sp.]
MFVLCTRVIAQKDKDGTEVNFPYVVLQNGTTVYTRYSVERNVLNVDIRNNPEEVEIVVVKNGIMIDNEVSDFEDDGISVDLSGHNNGAVDIYVRSRRENQYVGSVKAGIKPKE